MLKLGRWLLRRLAGFFQILAGEERAPDLFKGWTPIDEESVPPSVSKTEHGVPYPVSDTDSTGIYELILIHGSLPKHEALSLLPKGLVLDPDGPQLSDRHPVIFTLGYQRDVRTIFNRIGINYLECIVGLPSIKLADVTQGYRGPFIYMPRLRLNHLYPCILGWLCGYSKHWSRVKATASTIEIRSLFLGRKILHAEFKADGLVGAPGEYPNFAPIGPLLEQPAVGILFGIQLFTHLHWRLSKAKIQSASVDVEITGLDVPGLPPGKYHWDGIAKQKLGACRMSVPWQFIFPYDRNILDAKTGSFPADKAYAEAAADPGTPKAP